jgi:predicted MFS family arabinose efflux permease
MGLVLFVAFIAPALLALQQAQRMSASALPGFLALAAIGAAALVALIARERRASHPLLPIHLLRQATIWRSDALAACHGATLVSLITFVPIYLRVLRGTSASETGLLLLPLMFGVGGGSMLTGRIVSRTGLTTIFPTVGLAFTTLLLVLLSIFAGNLGPRQLSLYLLGCGLFMGTVMAVVQVTVQSAAGAASLGSAAASVQLSRSIGAAVGTALVGTVLFATLSLSDADTAGLFAELVQQGPDGLAALPPARYAMVQSEIAAAFRAAFLAMAAFAAAGLWLAWSIPARRLG